MKTTKKFALLVAAVATSLGLQAGTLYWQVWNNPNNDDYIAVVVQNAGGKVGYLNLLDGDGGSVVSAVTTPSDAMANVQYADITDYSSSEYSFYFEMLSLEGDNWVQGYTSSVMTYEQLNIAGYISSGGISASSVKVWTASVFIPEPTSGLLLLVGGSLLALRRKRRA